MSNIIGWIAVDTDGQAGLFADEPKTCIKSNGATGFYLENPLDVWVRREPQAIPDEYLGVMPGDKKEIEGIVIS